MRHTRFPALIFCAFIAATLAASPAADRVATVTGTPGCVAFWDFVQREPDGARRFTAHVPTGATNTFALDAGNYIHDYWGEGRTASYADFPLLGRGPFGEAIRIRKETDPTFRPFLFVPRARLHDSPIDLKGANQSVTVVVWAIRESGNHALAGIWHEGTDLKQTETATTESQSIWTVQKFNFFDVIKIAKILHIVASTIDKKIGGRTVATN